MIFLFPFVWLIFPVIMHFLEFVEWYWITLLVNIFGLIFMLAKLPLTLSILVTAYCPLLFGKGNLVLIVCHLRPHQCWVPRVLPQLFLTYSSVMLTLNLSLSLVISSKHSGVLENSQSWPYTAFPSYSKAALVWSGNYCCYPGDTVWWRKCRPWS